MALPENPGLAVSGGAHIGLVLLALLSFSLKPQQPDAPESFPVAVVSSEEFNQIARGEKAAAQVRPLPRSEKLAELPAPSQAPSPLDAQKEVPTPPSPLKRQPDPGEAEADRQPKPHDAPAPPAHAAKETPDRVSKAVPESKRLASPHAFATAQEDADEKAAEKPRPSKGASGASAVKEAPAAKKAQPQFHPDEVAKLLDQQKKKEKPESPSKQRSGDETKDQEHKFDLGSIAKFLSKEEPQRKQASAHELSHLASLGAPEASAAKMSPSLWSQLDGLLQEQYRRCWNFTPVAGRQGYVPEIHVQYTPEGTLVGEPKLLNPPSDPSLRALAESAMRAVRRCDPLQIPAQYQPYYEQWKARIVRFDPEEML